MPFNSVAFLLGFLPVTAAGCLLAGRLGPYWIKLWLIVTSVLFYGLNAPRQLPVLLAMLGMNLALAQAVRAGRRTRLLVAACGVGLNLAILCWFKYLAPTIWPDASLPPGISFFVFTQIGLLLWLAAPGSERVTLLDQTLFSVFFPVILAGPILNPHEMLPEFRRDRALEQDDIAFAQPSRPSSSFDRVIQTSVDPNSGHHGLGLTMERVAVGLGFFFIGLAKKSLLADPLGAAVAEGFQRSVRSRYPRCVAGSRGLVSATLPGFLRLYRHGDRSGMARWHPPAG